MDHRGGDETPYTEALVLASWAAATGPYVRGRAFREARVTDLDRLPATLYFDLIYSYLLEEDEEVVDRRGQLDEQLASFRLPSRAGVADRSDRAARAATWGKTPAQQRAMRRAIEAGTDAARTRR